ncbi:nitronate monooxygenase [uncultured Desulfosarcina sp.]|uniref:NAD(P)H-dependent flavin oxidoreductase n=1 Tax=uncultured Desulfosarcina sp. TaxID=218289 RepID=UPI0029C6E6FF|nr:nitronate monooxygenase [uncultured Desulfosarcina sp.]
MNQITDMLGTKYPIILGAMGFINNPEMVAAVSVAGGYGLLGTGPMRDKETLRQQIEKVRTLTDKPFGINLMAMRPLSMSFAEIAIEMNIPAVTTSAGSPKELAILLKSHGVKVIHVVPSAKAARMAEDAGVDAVVAEGMESGGMQGRNGVGTMVLVPLVVDAVKIPVIAAGGIADHRGYRAAFALGAQGVQMGTRFLASKECIAHEACKNTVCRAQETDTVLVGKGNIFIRAFKNAAAEKYLDDPSSFDHTTIVPRLEDVWLKGILEAGPITMGQIVGMIKELKSVREIIEEMVSQE